VNNLNFSDCIVGILLEIMILLLSKQHGNYLFGIHTSLHVCLTGY